MCRQPLRNSLGVKIWSPVSEGGYHRKHQIGYKWVIQKWDIAEEPPKCGPRLWKLLLQRDRQCFEAGSDAEGRDSSGSQSGGG